MAVSTAVLTGTGNVTTATSNSGTSITLNKPSNTADGDLLLATLYMRSGSTAYTTPPAGWTAVTGPVGTTTGLMLVYYKRIVSASAESATTYTWAGSPSSGRHAGAVIRVTGTHATSPIWDASTTYTTLVAGPPQLNLPSIDSTAAGTIIALIGANPSSAAAVSSAGYTQVANAITTTGATESELSVLTENVTTSGATGNIPITVSPTPTSGIGHLITIRSPNQAPSVNAGVAKAGAIGSATSFTAIITDPDGTIATRQWLQIDGPDSLTITNGTSNTMSVTPTVGGVYSFSITATDDVGATATDYTSLVVPAADSRPYDVTDNSGSWNVVGSKPTLETAVADELDQTYAVTPDAPNGAAVTFAMGSLTTGNITLVTRGRQSVTSPQISRKVELLQNSSVIASQTFNLTSALTDTSLVLTNAQNLAVTDRTKLFVRITDTQLP